MTMQQEIMEAEAREALWREELIEEIEQKVGGLKELEEAGKKEELIKWFSAVMHAFASLSGTKPSFIIVYMGSSLRVKSYASNVMLIDRLLF